MPTPYETTEEPIEPMESPSVEAMEHADNVVPFPGMDPPHIRQLQQRVIMLTKLSGLDNVASVLDEDELTKLGAKVSREYKIDRDSRDSWEKGARRAMDLAKQKKEAKSYPWPDASNVKYPLLTTSALQFAARAYPAIVDGQNVVKCKVSGADPQGMKASAAQRVGEYLSYQLLYEVPGWEDDLDTALHQIPIIGCAFKKTYPDRMAKCGYRSDLISAFDLVVNQRAKSLETVPRITHVFPLYPHEIGERKRSGWFLDVELGLGEEGDDQDAPHMFLEMHCWHDLDGDGTPEPWIVTVHEKTERVVRVKPCFTMDRLTLDKERGVIVRIKRMDYFTCIPFIPDPEGGFYPVGFGHLLEPLSDVIDTTINQMIDAGTLQNAGGGFVGGGVSLGKGKSEVRITPGVYRRVESAGPDLRQAIVHHEHPGPSQVLFNLLGMIVEAGKDVAAVKDILSGEMPKGATATGTMAVIEQGLKVFTAIYKRIYRALGREYRLIFEINKAYGDQQRYLSFFDMPPEMIANDFNGDMDIVPVSDPNNITDMQRLAKAQFVLEQSAGGQNPVVDHFAATKRAFEAARIENVEELLKQPQPDPVQQAGAMAEIGQIAASTDKTRAETDKLAAEAAAARAAIQLPLGIPIPIAEPAFDPAQLGMPPPQQQPGPPMGMDGPPGMMPPDMGMMGAPEMMPPQAQNPLIGMVPQLAQPEPQPGEAPQQ